MQGPNVCSVHAAEETDGRECPQLIVLEMLSSWRWVRRLLYTTLDTKVLSV
jgi:hypothetical protein